MEDTFVKNCKSLEIEQLSAQTARFWDHNVVIGTFGMFTNCYNVVINNDKYGQVILAKINYSEQY